MKLLVVCSIVTSLVFSAFTSGVVASEEFKRPKLSPNGLVTTLRLGRNGENTWEPNFDGQQRMTKLMTFHRLGRAGSRYSHPNEDYDLETKRTGTNSGLWFGPRLGRVQKRDVRIRNPLWPFIFYSDDMDDDTRRYLQDSEGTIDDARDSKISFDHNM